MMMLLPVPLQANEYNAAVDTRKAYLDFNNHVQDLQKVSSSAAEGTAAPSQVQQAFNLMSASLDSMLRCGGGGGGARRDGCVLRWGRGGHVLRLPPAPNTHVTYCDILCAAATAHDKCRNDTATMLLPGLLLPACLVLMPCPALPSSSPRVIPSQYTRLG